MLHDLIQTQEWGLNGFTLVAKLSCHLRERQYTLDFELRGSSCGIVLLRKKHCTQKPSVMNYCQYVSMLLLCII